jgi:hypothetical protein
MIGLLVEEQFPTEKIPHQREQMMMTRSARIEQVR